MPSVIQKWQNVVQITDSPPLEGEVEGVWSPISGAQTLVQGLGGTGAIESNILEEGFPGRDRTPLLLCSNPDNRVPVFARVNSIVVDVEVSCDSGMYVGLPAPDISGNMRSWSSADQQSWISAGSGSSSGIRDIGGFDFEGEMWTAYQITTWQPFGVRDTFGYGSSGQPPGNASRANSDGGAEMRFGLVMLSGFGRVRLRNLSRTITFVSPAFPGSFALSGPANGSSGVSLAPVLSWEQSSLAVCYRVVVSQNADLSNPVINTTLPAITRESQTPVSQYQVPSGVLIPGTTYYWRAYAINYAEGNNTSPQETASSSVFSFTTQMSAPFLTYSGGLAPFAPSASTPQPYSVAFWMRADTSNSDGTPSDPRWIFGQTRMLSSGQRQVHTGIWFTGTSGGLLEIRAVRTTGMSGDQPVNETITAAVPSAKWVMVCVRLDPDRTIDGANNFHLSVRALDSTSWTHASGVLSSVIGPLHDPPPSGSSTETALGGITGSARGARVRLDSLGVWNVVLDQAALDVLFNTGVGTNLTSLLGSVRRNLNLPRSRGIVNGAALAPVFNSIASRRRRVLFVLWGDSNMFREVGLSRYGFFRAFHNWLRVRAPFFCSSFVGAGLGNDGSSPGQNIMVAQELSGFPANLSGLRSAYPNLPAPAAARTSNPPNANATEPWPQLPAYFPANTSGTNLKSAIVRPSHPLGTKNALRAVLFVGGTGGAGSFTMRVRLSDNPYTEIVSSTVSIGSLAVDQVHRTEMNVPADPSRTVGLQLNQIKSGTTLVAPVVMYQMGFERPFSELPYGVGVIPYLSAGGYGLYEELDDMINSPDAWVDHMLRVWRDLVGGDRGAIVMVVHSKTNDTNRTSPGWGSSQPANSAQGYIDQFHAFRSRVLNRIRANGWRHLHRFILWSGFDHRPVPGNSRFDTILGAAPSYVRATKDTAWVDPSDPGFMSALEVHNSLSLASGGGVLDAFHLLEGSGYELVTHRMLSRLAAEAGAVFRMESYPDAL